MISYQSLLYSTVVLYDNFILTVPDKDDKGDKEYIDRALEHLK